MSSASRRMTAKQVPSWRFDAGASSHRHVAPLATTAAAPASASARERDQKGEHCGSWGLVRLSVRRHTGTLLPKVL